MLPVAAGFSAGWACAELSRRVPIAAAAAGPWSVSFSPLRVAALPTSLALVLLGSIALWASAGRFALGAGTHGPWAALLANVTDVLARCALGRGLLCGRFLAVKRGLPLDAPHPRYAGRRALHCASWRLQTIHALTPPMTLLQDRFVCDGQRCNSEGACAGTCAVQACGVCGAGQNRDECPRAHHAITGAFVRCSRLARLSSCRSRGLRR